uniref:Sulfatase N-terminal domain-containing protein n=1 Tax=Strigamia maritima TaxID=126957 RepID=T1J5M2_STRMM
MSVEWLATLVLIALVAAGKAEDSDDDDVNIQEIDVDGDDVKVTNIKTGVINEDNDKNRHKRPNRKQPPNIIFILGDDIGHNDVGWNNPNFKTPHMNKLAKEGVLLDQFYAMPLCTPSRATLLTGLYAQQLGLQRYVLGVQEPYGVPLKFKFLPQALKRKGYHTHAMGKWHLGFCDKRYTPTYRGFDTFFGFYQGFEENYQHCLSPNYIYDPISNCTGFDFRDNTKVAKKYNGKYSSYIQNDRAIKIIENHNKYHARQPLFMYVALSAEHFPVQGDKFTPECANVTESRKQFCGAMIGVDQVVHNISEALKKSKFYNNSILVFVSDNGGAVSFGGNNFPLRGDKGTLYEGGTRVPGFIHSPLLKKTGYTHKGIFHMVDWYTTFLHLAEITPDKNAGLNGVNQWESVSEDKPSPRTEFPYSMDMIEGTIIGAVRVGDYKLIDGPTGNDDRWVTENETLDKSYDSAYLVNYTSGNKKFRFLLTRIKTPTFTLSTSIKVKLNTTAIKSVNMEHQVIIFIFISIPFTFTGAKTAPNILFILGDDIGYNDVGWHNKLFHTPTLDELAKTGTILENYYSYPLCTPSRATLMTGVYASQLGLQRGVLLNQEPYGVPLRYQMLPERLKEAGYATHAIGKWHLGYCNKKYTPLRRGFDTFLGFYNGAAENYLHCVSRHYLYTKENCTGLDIHDNGELGYKYAGKFSSEVYADQADKIIRSHNKRHPLFIYLSLAASHLPLQAPAKYMKNCMKNVNEARRKLCATMAAEDAAVAKVLLALKQTDMYDNTVIIFASDNGGSADYGGNNFPLRGEKNSLWEGGTRVPAFVHSPLLHKKCTINNHLMHVSDWYPTILKLADLEPRKIGDYKLIAGPGGIYNQTIPEYQVVDYSYNVDYILTKTLGRSGYDVSDRKSKLFNLNHDPFETTDLADDMPVKVKELWQRIEHHRKRMKNAVKFGEAPAGNPENFYNVYTSGWCLAYFDVPKIISTHSLIASKRISTMQLAVHLAVVAFCGALHLSDGKKPHLIFIMGDDMGYNDVGWHNKLFHTPHMDKLAKSGVILEQYYSLPLCTPSRVALMSGIYPSLLGLQRGVLLNQEPYGIPLKYEMIPKRLKEAGYHTHQIGK